MTGDFSIDRYSKKPYQEKGFIKVLLQQGRVLTDADWNELVDIQELHDTKSLRDIMGQNGIPMEQQDSFKVTPLDGNRYVIKKGRIYVDGILVENFSDVEAAFQPYLPSVTDTTEIGVENRKSEAIPVEKGIYLAYLDVWHRHITYNEDPEILESALGGPDTTTRMQVVWQVKLHKLDDKEEQNLKEYKWTPWISLQNSPNGIVVSDIKVVSNNNNNLLEVFALLKPTAGTKSRASIRELSLEPVTWERKWTMPTGEGEGLGFLKFESALDFEGFLEIFAIHLGTNEPNALFQSIIKDNERWDSIHFLPTFEVKEIAIGKNKNGLFELFVVNFGDEKIWHSKQKALTTDWSGGWKPIGNMQFTKLSVTLNPKDACIEVYGISKTDGKIWFARQNQPDSSDWDENWKKIGTDSDTATDPDKFVEVAVVVNKNDQVIVFASDMDLGSLWTIFGGNSSSVDNKWTRVGKKSPGKLISGISIQADIKNQGLLRLFAVFSDPQISHPDEGNVSGNVWTISENEDGSWNSQWQLLNHLNAIKVSSAVDSLSRLNVFAIESKTGVVYHSYAEEIDEVISCDLEVQSWNTKTNPSSIQLKARTKPGRPLLPADSCILPQNAGYRKLENQLYRIEIHQKKSDGINATFKYSKDNGTICSKILDISADKITVASVGKDSLLRFQDKKWVEITDDLLELWGMSGILVLINKVEGMDLFFDTTDPSISKLVNNTTFPSQFNPKARQWDSPGAVDVNIPTDNDGFIELADDSGIQVQFNKIDDCRIGDYFTIPARTLKADVEWPKGSDGLPEFVDAEGITHHYARLAFLKFTADNKLEVISDCRRFFSPLTDLASLSYNAKPIVWWTHGTLSRGEPSVDPIHLASSYSVTGATYARNPAGLHSIDFPINVSYSIDPNKKTVIEKIILLFSTSGETKIIEIVIYDGVNEIPPIGPLSLSGQHDKKPDDSNTITLDPPVEIHYGIGVSVNVLFNTVASLGGSITFTSLGLQLKTI